MALLHDVRRICDRLAPGGWHGLLLRHGLDILAEDLASELGKVLVVDRSVLGFEDFSLRGERGIEPGNPSRSLLYHALASPNVSTDAREAPLGLYPSAGEIESILNYVYGARFPSLSDIRAQADGAPLAIVVFAVEYRPRPETVHRKHADLCFSRTGILRVGTAPAFYDDQRRGFLPLVEGDPKAMRVTPARYAAYLAVQRKGDSQRFGPKDFQEKADGDHLLDFWIPLHKLFNGPECLRDLDIVLSFDDQHVNDKLRRFHLAHPDDDWAEPVISGPPFVVADGLAAWADAEMLGDGLLLPTPRPRLVEPAVYDDRFVGFKVPRPDGSESGWATTDLDSPTLPLPFQRASIGGFIIHQRHQLRDDGSIHDLNTEPDVDAIVEAGGYRALHYVDFTAEGSVRAVCPALKGEVPANVAAYSIIAAPNFYPEVSQRGLIEWDRDQGFPSPPDQIWYARLAALSDIRYPANPDLPGGHFGPEDKGVTAIVAHPLEEGEEETLPPVGLTHRQSWLPDAAAGLFGPGWEIATDRVNPDDHRTTFLCGYRLGSPLTEDVRLCAAVGSYWPAVSPDTTRTFEPTKSSRHTVIPLTDAEIGLVGNNPWDGVVGPRLIDYEGRQVVEYTALAYSDYTQGALREELSLQLTSRVGPSEYYERVLVMQQAYKALDAHSKTEKGMWAVLSFDKIVRPHADLAWAEQEAGQTLQDNIYGFKIYRHGAVSTPADFTRRHVAIEELACLFVSPDFILIKRDQDAWQAIEIAQLL